MSKHHFDIEDDKTSAANSIRRIADLLDRTPTEKQYKKNQIEGELSSSQILYRFGLWSDAVKFAGLKPNASQVPPKQPEIPEQQLIDNFVRVANKLGQIPGRTRFRSESQYSWAPYKTKWGSWRKAVDYIVKYHSDRFSFDAHIKPKQRKTGNKRRPLKISLPLKYEPSNEYETIVLFSLLAEQLGYRIIKVQSNFPDAIIEQNGEEIEVEFEYLSSNYIQHCHPMDFKGICICWRKDTHLDGISILSLEEYIRNLHKKANSTDTKSRAAN